MKTPAPPKPTPKTAEREYWEALAKRAFKEVPTSRSYGYDYIAALARGTRRYPKDLAETVQRLYQADLAKAYGDDA